LFNVSLFDPLYHSEGAHCTTARESVKHTVENISQSAEARRFMWPKVRLLGLALAVLVGFVGCSTPQIPPTVPTLPSVPPMGDATTATNTAELQADLDKDLRLYVNSIIVSNGTLKPPANSVIVFGSSGKLSRDLSSSGPAVEVSTANVSIVNLRVQGSDPCYWTNTIPFNPDSKGEMYAQYNSSREEQAALYTRPGARNLLVDGLYANDVWGDGVTLLGGDGITMNNVNVRCAGRSGISNVDSANVTVSGGTISGVFWWGLNIEPFGSHSVSNYRVQNITMGYSRDKWLFAGGPNFNCDVHNVDARGNMLLPSSTRPANIDPCISIAY